MTSPIHHPFRVGTFLVPTNCAKLRGQAPGAGLQPVKRNGLAGKGNFSGNDRTLAPETGSGAPYSALARLSVAATGLRSTPRRLYQPAARASSPPVNAPARGTQGDGRQLNSNT
ncbi:MAG: hypothetical protein RL375_3643 [Pseudomonadota bacterium]